MAMEIELHRVLDALPSMIWTVLTNGKVEFVNRRWMEYTGLRYSDRDGWKWQDTVEPEDLQDLIEQWQAIEASGEVGDITARIRSRSGDCKLFRIECIPILNDAGSISGWCNIATDIGSIDSARTSELKRAEAKLLPAEDDRLKIINALPTAAWSTRPDGYCNFVSDRWLEFTGMNSEQAEGWGWISVVHPGDIQRLLAHWRAHLHSGLAADIEVRMRGSDGHYRWFLYRANPLRDDVGNIIVWYGANIDIEDRKRAEEALIESERQARLIVDRIPALVVVMGPHGETEYLNAQFLDYVGLPRAEAMNWETNETVHPDDLAGSMELFARSLQTGEPYSFENRLRGADGVYRWFQVRGLPLTDTDGRVRRWYGVITDVDDRRRAEENLRESERQLRLIVSTIPGLVVVFGPDGLLESANQQMLDYVGQTLNEFKDWATNGSVHPDDLAPGIAKFTNSLISGDPYEFEVRIRRRDGVYRWFQVRGNPARDANGIIIRWYGLLIDIDDRKQAEVALADSERESRLIVHTVAGMIALFTPDGRLNGGNQQLLDYFQLPLEEVANWATNGITHPDDLQYCIDTFRRSVETGEPYDYETRFRRHDGVYRWFQIRGHPLRNADGRIVRWYGLLTDIDDRRNANEALRQSQRELQSIVNTIPGLIVVIAPDGTIVGVNDQALSYAGYTLEHFRNWQANDIVHPDDLSRAIAAFSRSIASGDAYEIEERLRRWDGIYRWFQVRANPVRDTGGSVVRWYFLLIDIDDRKRAEVALADSERESRLIVHTVAGMIVLFTPDGKLNGGNQQLLDYFQLPLQEVANWATNGITHPDDLQHCIDEFTRSLCTGESYAFETRFRRHDGVYRWFQIRGHPLRDEDGSIIRWYGLLTDIDDRKRAEDELRRSETFLMTGQRISQTGTFSWMVDSDKLTFSDELLRIFEFDDEDVITVEKVLERIHPDDMALQRERIAGVRNGVPSAEYEVRLVTPTGGLKYLRVISQVIEHKDGRREDLGAVQDVTQRRLAEGASDRLRTELARATGFMSLGQMSASIAHEVNQPLSGVITNASTCLRLLSADPPNIDIALEATRRTIRDGNRAADVIARLRALFSKREIAFEALDLNEAVQEVITLSVSDRQRSRIILRTNFGKALPMVTGDRVQIQQVIMNLLRNATEAVNAVSDRPREIIIKTDVDQDGNVRFSVRDNGIGFGQDGRQRIFEAFYTTKSDGMGIGLSVSRSIIESHNGRLWAEVNDRPGVTMCFSIPQLSREEIEDSPSASGIQRITKSEVRAQ
jgi:PAS domain S-box-containing protein